MIKNRSEVIIADEIQPAKTVLFTPVHPKITRININTNTEKSISKTFFTKRRSALHSLYAFILTRNKFLSTKVVKEWEKKHEGSIISLASGVNTYGNKENLCVTVTELKKT